MKKNNQICIWLLVCALICSMGVNACKQETPAKTLPQETQVVSTEKHVSMLEVRSHNYSLVSQESDYHVGEQWNIFYNGTVEYCDEKNLSGKINQNSWNLNQKEMEELQNLLNEDFMNYTKDYNSAADGTGYTFTFYGQDGTVIHEFDGYIYSNATMNQILEIISEGNPNLDNEEEKTDTEIETEAGTINQSSSFEEAPKSMTMLVYVVGSNLESEGGAASLDMEEMAKAGVSSDDFHLLVCTGGSSYWWLEDIPDDSCNVYSVENGNFIHETELSGKNMADPDTLTEFLDYGYENSDTEGYSLVLWNHGGGSLVGYGADENYDYDILSIDELSNSLSTSKICSEKSGFEWLGFDACLMGMVEVASALEPYSNYLIASEEVESAYGWDYSCIKELSKPENFQGAVAGTCIVDSYRDFYQENYRIQPDLTLSCLDLSETQTVVSYLEQLVSAAEIDLTEGQYSTIARMRRGTRAFGVAASTSIYDSVDLYDLALEMEDKYPKESKQLQSALDDMIVHQQTNISGAYGVAVYFPYDNKEYSKLWVEQYKNMDFSNGYSEFISAFTSILNGEALSDWSVSTVVPEVHGDNVYSIQLTPEQVSDYAKGYLSIWEKQEDSNFFSCMMRNSNVTLDENGVLTANFDGMEYMLVNEEGDEAPCMMFEIERTEDYQKCVVPLIVIRGMDSMSLYMHIRFDKENPEGVIIGLYDSADADKSLIPSKQIYQFEEGDIIDTFLFARQIAFNEDGSLKPMGEWGGGTSYFNEIVYTSGTVTLASKPFDFNGEFYCLFQIKDTQGEVHETDLVQMQP